jgi:thiol-disulfide isomerase/thioredoxin
MNMNKLRWLGLVAMMAAGASVARGGEITLKVGDPAPKLATGKWVQGEPVKGFEKGKAYIVEFWATWCGPCRVSIPHLNEVYEKFKDKGLVVIGQDCWEKDDDLVAPFVKKMGEKMTYRVALDDKSGAGRGMMAKTWMEAAGRNGIPSAFLVDKRGLIAWIGHPMQLQEKLIEEVLAGTFDVHKAAAAYDTQQQNEAKLNTAWVGVSQAIRQKDWDKAEAKLAEAEKLLPEDQRGGMDATRLDILFGKEDYAAAYKLARKQSDAHKGDAMFQNQLAWRIVADENIKERDLAVAELCATRANDASQAKDPTILDTVARVKFMQGQKQQAIELQEKAVRLADGDMKAQLEKTLDSYKRGELSKAE